MAVVIGLWLLYCVCIVGDPSIVFGFVRNMPGTLDRSSPVLDKRIGDLSKIESHSARFPTMPMLTEPDHEH